MANKTSNVPAVAMDDYQLRALRCKRHLIATNLILDDVTVNELLKKKLITQAMLDEMKDETSSFGRVVKYLEVLELCVGVGKNVFNRICQFLDTNFPVIHDEIVTELKAVKGELTIDSYLRHEAQILVYREFETIRRLSDIEKQDMTSLVALRAQVYKQMWKRRMGMAEKRLEELLKQNNANSALQRKLLKSVSEYVRINKKRLNNQGRGFGTNQILDVEGIDDRELIHKLVGSSTDLITLSEQALAARRVGLDEKKRVLKVLDVTDTVIAKMDRETSTTLEPINAELNAIEESLAQKQARNDALKKQLADNAAEMERQRQEMDELIRQAKERLDKETIRTRDLKVAQLKLTADLQECKRLAIKYRAKYAVMDRTRQLGYIDKNVLVDVSYRESTVHPKATREAAVNSRLARRQPVALSSYNNYEENGSR